MSEQAADARIQPALHAFLGGDAGGLRAALTLDPGLEEIVRHLLARGASASIEDDEYHSDATRWADAGDDGSPLAHEIARIVREQRGIG